MKFLVCPALEECARVLDGLDLGDRVLHAKLEAYSCKKAGSDKRLFRQMNQQLVKELSDVSLSPHASPITSPLVASQDLEAHLQALPSISPASLRLPSLVACLKVNQFPSSKQAQVDSLLSHPSPASPTSQPHPSSSSHAQPTRSSNSSIGPQRRSSTYGSARVSLTNMSPVISDHPLHYPMGLTSASSRALLINLIATLNSSFPDSDFSDLRPHDLEHEPHAETVQHLWNHLFLNTIEDRKTIATGFRTHFWNVVNDVVVLSHCDVYRYKGDVDLDIGQSAGDDERTISGGQQLQTCLFLCHSKKAKKILLLACSLAGKYGAGTHEGATDDEELDHDANHFELGFAFPGDWPGEV